MALALMCVVSLSAEAPKGTVPRATADRYSAHAEQSGATERAGRKGRHARPSQQQGERNHAQQYGRKDARASDAVGEPASQRPAECGEQNEARGAEPGVGRR